MIARFCRLYRESRAKGISHRRIILVSSVFLLSFLLLYAFLIFAAITLIWGMIAVFRHGPHTVGEWASLTYGGFWTWLGERTLFDFVMIGVVAGAFEYLELRVLQRLGGRDGE